jgi:hypothetical protein
LRLSVPDNELYLLLGRIDGKLDAALQRQARSEERLDAVEVRLAKFENWRSYLIGIAAAVAAAVSFLKPIIIGLFQ